MDVLWDYRVVLDVFLGGVGISAFLFATILFFIDAQKYVNVIKKSWIISPILIIAGLLLLLTELGRPLSVIKAAFNTNFSSVMSIGMFLQGICVALMLFIVLKLFTSKIETISKPLVIVTSILAGLIGVYHGCLFTGIDRAAWTDSIPTMFFISSILSGMALVVIMNLNDKGFSSLKNKYTLPLVFNGFIVIQAVTLFSWVYTLSLKTIATKEVYAQLMSSYCTEFLVFIILGLVIPALVFITMLVKKSYCKGSYILACLSLLVGSVVLKYIVVYLGQMV